MIPTGLLNIFLLEKFFREDRGGESKRAADDERDGEEGAGPNERAQANAAQRDRVVLKRDAARAHAAPRE